MLKPLPPLLRKQKKRCNPGSSRLTKRSILLADIEYEWLKSAGIQGIILDLDNTIVSEDDRYLSPQAENWIIRAKSLGFKFFILSNGKRRHRALYWSERLNISAINPARKPLPPSFHKALQKMKLEASQVVVIGDSLHTDVIGAWLVGCHCIQVASLPHPPRWWERLLGRWVQIPYPPTGELWDAKICTNHYRDCLTDLPQ